MNRDIIYKELVQLDLEAESTDEVFSILAEKLEKAGYIRSGFLEAIKEREKNYPTALPIEPYPVAIPHTTKDHVIKQAICALRLRHPVMFQRMDDPDEQVEVKYVLNLALLDDSEHVEIIARVIRYLKDDSALKEMDLEKLLKNKFLTAKGED